MRIDILRLPTGYSEEPIKYLDLDYDIAKEKVMGYFQEIGEAYPTDVEEDLELDYELVCQITEELKREGRLELL